MLHLLDLNDDCLEHICQFLPLDEQLTATHVCGRLSGIIKTLWRQRKVITLTYDRLLKFKTSPADFVEFFANAKHSLEELHMDRVESHQLKLLQNLTFSKMRFLDCNLWHSGAGTNDQDVLLLIKLFPALNKLILLSNVTGKHICTMRNVVDLDLSCCEQLKTKYLAKIFKTLKLRKFSLLFYGYNTVLNERLNAITECNTLEELHIDDHHLLLIIDGLLRMSNLRKIVSYTRDYDEYLLGKIALALGPRIHTMMYTGVFWSRDKHLEGLMKMPNLRRLVMSEDDIEDEQVQAIAVNLQQLREFHFMQGRLESEDSLLQFIKYSEHLEILNISQTPVSAAFLTKLINAVNASGRSRPLSFYCAGTSMAKVDLQKFVIPEQLHIIRTQCFVQTPYTRCIQCEWLPEALSS